MLWKEKTTRSKRYYYVQEDGNGGATSSSSSGLFEQSLDIYKPIVKNDQDLQQITSKNLPTVILVVGSGWVGHRAIIYAGTSWWNSSGPQTIANLGCTCVCVRHRGAFCCLPSIPIMAQCLTGVMALVSAVAGWRNALTVVATLAIVAGLLAIGGRGSATFEDMLEDVAEALRWVNNNRDLLRIEAETKNKKDILTPATSRSSSSTDMTKRSSALSSSSEGSDLVSTTENTAQNHDNSQPSPLVFGGYSSGGHVAAMLLQQPDLFRKHGLPLPTELFQGVLMISGVLAVRPAQFKSQDKHKHTTVIATPPGRPQWLSDLIITTVFGSKDAEKLPSPLAQHNDPKLPHLLVGCRNEVFGLHVLDVFFCSRQYAEKVQHVTGKFAKYVPIESDHWNILNSTALHDALEEEMPKLLLAK